MYVFALLVGRVLLLPLEGEGRTFPLVGIG